MALPFWSALASSVRPRRQGSPRPVRARRAAHQLRLEPLEERALLAGDISIAISDATATEGSTALKVLDRFVQEGSSTLTTPRSSIFGGDVNGDGLQDLYVVSGGTDEILRYDGQSGAFLDVFVAAGSGGLDIPGDLRFGPDGDLYVSSIGPKEPGLGAVLRFDGQTGNFIATVASDLSAPLGLTFGADGSLYIANQLTDEILRHDGSILSVFVAAGSGGLDFPRNALFGPDGNGDAIADLYVSSSRSDAVLRYDGLSGAFIDTFAATSPGQGPLWLAFGPDGDLYATTRTTTLCCDTSVVRLDGATGAQIATFDLGRDGWSFQFGPDGLIYNSGNGAGNFVDRLGPSSLAPFTVTLSSPSDMPVSVNYSTADGSAMAGSDYTASSGTITFSPGQTSRTILVQTLDDSAYEGNETFVVNLSNPSSGAIITDEQGAGTIVDNDLAPTKFYVVDDGSPDQTYEYGDTGAAVENYAIDSGNSAPRGAASTAAGDKVWVVDANKTVYVYNASGGLFGSWSAGTLPSKAAPEGIATNGTDVWIVDGKSDKVFKYTGAASRLSGSQNGASSFSLNRDNKDPKDIVTDGTSLWVVNDSTSDKVFKYTVSGALLGSWTISAGGGSPTGITLDPASVSHLWIVDRATDRVYQYDNAANLTSGSQSASASFALAAGNTNPQGIADPPVAPPTEAGRGAAETPRSGDTAKGEHAAPVLLPGILAMPTTSATTPAVRSSVACETWSGTSVVVAPSRLTPVSADASASWTEITNQQSRNRRRELAVDTILGSFDWESDDGLLNITQRRLIA